MAKMRFNASLGDNMSETSESVASQGAPDRSTSGGGGIGKNTKKNQQKKKKKSKSLSYCASASPGDLLIGSMFS